MKRILFFFVAATMLLAACAPTQTAQPPVVSNPGGVQYATSVSLVAGEISQGVLGKDCNTGLLGEFRQKTGICVTPKYLGPVDLLNSSKAKEADLYFAEDSIWFGPDAKDPTTIAKSIVVVGIDKNVAIKTDFGIQDLTALVQKDTVKPVICNANRCNAGALFYVSLLTGLKENPGDILTVEDVKNEKIVAAGKAIYGKVARGSNSSQEAADVYLADKINNANLYNAIVVEEPIGADLNKRLVAAGKAPLQFVYLIDGTATTNLTLAYIDKGATKKNSFDALKVFLLDPKNQDKFAKAGFRGAVFGTKVSTDVLKEEWGLKVNPVFAYIPSPTTVTAQDALKQYIMYKRPVMINICNDHSGSMDTNGGASGLIDAMTKIFDAKPNGWRNTQKLEVNPSDKYVVYGFGDTTTAPHILESSDPEKMANFAKEVNAIPGLGGTALYDCAKVAYDYAAAFSVKKPEYAVIVVLMTDGQNTKREYNRDNFIAYYNDQKLKLPIYAIAFGADASKELGYENFGKKVNGLYYDGTKNLSDAFKQILGGN